MDKQARKKFHTTRALVIGIVALVVLIGAMLYAWVTNRQQPVEGSKSITVAVIDNEGQQTDYSLKTDAEYLRQALEEIDGLTIEGEESAYGLYVKTVNGLTADYDTDGAYWSFYINGEYCTEGVDSQPVTDGDAFTIQYESAG